MNSIAGGPFKSADPANVTKDFWKSSYEAIRIGS
jgi:hypothetical protein